MTNEFNWIDILALVLYFVLVFLFGIWSSCKNRGSVGGYFLAGRSMNFLTVGTSLFASNIGSVSFVGLAGSGASNGIGVAVYELSGVFFLLLLGWVFAPLYLYTGIVTIPEYLKKRFGGHRIRTYISCLSLLLYILCKISVDLFAGALFIKVSLGWNIYLSIIILILIAALFATIGGLTAVMWTDFIQAFIMIIGSIVVIVIGLNKVDGFETVKRKYAYSLSIDDLYSNKTCSLPPKDSWNLFRDVDSDLPYPGVFIGLTVISIWYFCSDQVMVQRTLASKNMTQLKLGVILCGYLKLLPLFIMIIPGMISKILYADEIGCSDPNVCLSICESKLGCSNVAYALLIVRLLPTGLRGLMLASMMAALLSSLTSVFNSASTLFTMDIYKRLRKQAKDIELLIAGKVFVLILVAISIAWIPILREANGSQIFVYLQSVTSYFSPPLGSVFILAIFWKRCNEQGAFWGLMIGLICGFIRLVWEFSYSIPSCGEIDTRPKVITINYLYYAIILWIICTISTVTISLLTKPVDPERTKITFMEIMRNVNKKKVIKENNTTSIESLKIEEQIIKDSPIRKKLRDMNKKEITFWLFGLENNESTQKDDDDNEDYTNIDISESPKQKLFCNTQAIILMSITGFFWAFFNKYN